MISLPAAIAGHLESMRLAQAQINGLLIAAEASGEPLNLAELSRHCDSVRVAAEVASYFSLMLSRAAA